MRHESLRGGLAMLFALFLSSSSLAAPMLWPFDTADAQIPDPQRTLGECPPECVDGCIDFSPRSRSNERSAGTWQTLVPDSFNTPVMTADAGDFLGSSVAVFGDHMVVVAALENQGMLYFYRRIGGQWVFQSRRAASQSGEYPAIRPALYDRSDNRMILGGANGQFIIVRLDGDVWHTEPLADGVIELNTTWTGIAIDGDRAIVTNLMAGKIKVLAWNGSSWQLESEWTLPDVDWASGSGLSADLQGDRLVIGDPAKTIAAVGRVGRVLVYRREGAAWTLEATLTHPETEANLQFGFSVAIDGDLIAAGARGDEVGARTNAGSASVFRNVGGVWTRLHTLTPDATVTDGGFGWRVVLAGGHLYASQYGWSLATFDGGLFEYDLSTPAPTLLNHLVEPGSLERLGTGFDVVGNELYAGAPGRSTRGGIKAFTRVGSSWALQQTIEQEWRIPPVNFGAAVAVSGNHLMVRESRWPAAPNVVESVVHAYELQGGQWQRVQTLHAPVAQATAGFGANIALNGNIALIARSDDSQRIAELHAYHFENGQWQYVDSADLAPLVASFIGVSGVGIHFIPGGAVVGIHGFAWMDSPLAHEVRVFDLGDDGHFIGWDTLNAPNPTAWHGYGQAIAADGDWVAVHDAYGIVTETQVRGVTSIFRRTATGWVRQWDLPSEVTQSINACGIGATYISGGLALIGDRLFVGVGAGQTAGGEMRDASIDSYTLDPSLFPQRFDTRPTNSLQLLTGGGRLGLFESGGLSFFDPSTPLSMQSPTAIVPPRTYYAPVVDFSATHIAFGVPWIEEPYPSFMGEAFVLALGNSEVPVPITGAALALLIAVFLAIGALHLSARR